MRGRCGGGSLRPREAQRRRETARDPRCPASARIARDRSPRTDSRRRRGQSILSAAERGLDVGAFLSAGSTGSRSRRQPPEGSATLRRRSRARQDGKSGRRARSSTKSYELDPAVGTRLNLADCPSTSGTSPRRIVSSTAPRPRRRSTPASSSRANALTALADKARDGRRSGSPSRYAGARRRGRRRRPASRPDRRACRRGCVDPGASSRYAAVRDTAQVASVGERSPS